MVSGSGREVTRTTTPRQGTAYMRPMSSLRGPTSPYSGVGPGGASGCPLHGTTEDPIVRRQTRLGDLLAVAGRGRIRGQTLRRRCRASDPGTVPEGDADRAGSKAASGLAHATPSPASLRTPRDAPTVSRVFCSASNRGRDPSDPRTAYRTPRIPASTASGVTFPRGCCRGARRVRNWKWALPLQ